VPSASALPTVKVQAPVPSAVVVPKLVLPPRNNSTVLLASAVPVNVGVLTLVRLSVLEEPLSLAASRSGVDGAAGAVASIVMLRAPEAAEAFPAASVAVAVMEWTPAVRLMSLVHEPVTLAMVVPLEVAPSKSSTVLLASAVPEIVRADVFLVMLSELETPVSSAAAKSSPVGGVGASVSIVTRKFAEAPLVLPAASVAVAVKV